MKGKVRWYNGTSGFIDGEDGKEYYMYFTNVIDDIGEGDDVTFEVREQKSRLIAMSILSSWQ